MIKKFIPHIIGLVANYKKYKAKILTILSQVRFSVYPLWLMYQPQHYKVTGRRIGTIQNTLRVGDILLRGYDKKYLDSMCIPNSYGYSHAGIYTGRNKVVHADAKGVIEEHLIDFCQCDRIKVLRIGANAKQAVQLASQYLGTPYDFQFQTGDDALYCFQLITACYPHIQWQKAPLKLFGFTLPRILGTCYLDSSIIDNPQCETVYEYNGLR